MKVDAIIQARCGSKRLPNKIFYELSELPLIHHVVERLYPSKGINEIIISTTKSKSDDILENWCLKNNIKHYRGSESNVLKRYYNTALKYNSDIIVRVTADDPFKDFRIIDNAIKILKERKLDYVTNNLPVSFPEGLDVEVMTFEALQKSFFNSISNYEKEHVTQYIQRNQNSFKIFNIKNEIDLSNHRWTIDTIKDYEFVKEVYKHLYKSENIFMPEEIYSLLKLYPSLREINNNEKRSDLYNKL